MLEWNCTGIDSNVDLHNCYQLKHNNFQLLEWKHKQNDLYHHNLMMILHIEVILDKTKGTSLNISTEKDTATEIPSRRSLFSVTSPTHFRKAGKA